MLILLLIVLLLGAMMITSFWTLVAPRRMWWLFSAWHYRHPAANEPSDADYVVQQIIAVVILALSAGCLAALIAGLCVS